MNTILRIIAFCTFICLTACGGGGGGGSSTTSQTTNADATGVWTGTFTQNGAGTAQLTGIIANNQLRFLSIDAGALYEGVISVNGNKFTSSTTNYEIGGTIFSSGTQSGTVNPGKTLSGTFQNSDGSSGTFSLTYDPITSRGASLATISANWTITVGSDSLTLSIDTNGTITGSDTSGCVYNGSVTISNTGVNIYTLAISIASCSDSTINGAYTGYAVVTDNTTTNDTLIYEVSNPNYLFAGTLNRS